MKERKYGLLLAISMVIGIVIGSGIFFKSDDVLVASGGSFSKSVLAWVVGGIAMIFGAITISSYASRISKANGIIDYFEFVFSKISTKAGELAGFVTGWYMSLLYYPALSAVVAWVAAQYTALLFGIENSANSTTTWVIAAAYVIIISLIAVVARFISSKIQVSATVIKLIPLFLIAIIGTIYGLANGVSFELIDSKLLESTPSFTTAVIATAFAFDGWFIATAINDELKNPKKDLPKALIFGTLGVLIIYVAYFSGIVATVGADTVISEGDAAVNIAASKLFGNSGGTILTVFVIISCLGTVNGLVMATSRSYYQNAIRGNGFFPKEFAKVNEFTKTPILSSVAGFVITSLMLVIWWNTINGTKLAIDISSLPIVLNYTFFIILYVGSIILFKDNGIFKRFIAPTLAIIGAGIIFYGGVIDPSIGKYMIISAVIILAAFPVFYVNEANRTKEK